MNGPARSNERLTESFGVPWEASYGYEQAVLMDGTIYISGQLSHTADGTFVAPAPLNESGVPSDFANMEAQFRQSYLNAKELLSRFGATLDDVVEETIYVIDMDSGFAAATTVRKQMYGTDRPRVASTIAGVPRLALPVQLVEISFRAVLRRVHGA